MTSPPYLNAIDYMRRGKFSLVWMGYNVGELRQMRSKSVGAEIGLPTAHDDGETIKRIIKAAKLPEHLSPKATRHAMAMLLIGAGTNPKAVQERMGHSRITTTLGSYAHVLPGMHADISEEIERLLDAKK